MRDQPSPPPPDELPPPPPPPPVEKKEVYAVSTQRVRCPENEEVVVVHYDDGSKETYCVVQRGVAERALME